MAATAAQLAQTPAPILVSRRELPLYCPRDGGKLWSQHPRVFLPIEKMGACTCPYCGASYQMRD